MLKKIITHLKRQYYKREVYDNYWDNFNKGKFEVHYNQGGGISIKMCWKDACEYAKKGDGRVVNAFD